MDALKNKQFGSFDYTSRYIGVPYYFNTADDKYIYGIGQNMKKTTANYSHVIEFGDTLDKLALKYYNNPTYWWVIAYFNDILDAFEPLYPKYTTIKIPNISSIEFSNERS